MDKRLIWTVKVSGITPTEKKLRELSEREDLFDISSVDIKSKQYKDAVRNFETAEKMGCSIVTYIDDLYPDCLRSISSPPPVLYVLGNAHILSEVVFAGIVGARDSDDYGNRTAQNVAMEIGETGAGIVSGGAKGIDAAAHSGALRANAPTVAVLGCGLDVVYPKSNKRLFDKIVKSGGAIISEFPFGEPPLKTNFPRRNRIIAALSSAVLVVRAGKRSGALITATQAIGMNKTVFAVPGNIDNRLSQGTNELIRDGALVFLSSVDIIDELIAKNPDFFVRERSAQKSEVVTPHNSTEKTGEEKLPAELSEYEREIVNIINDGFNTQYMIEEKASFDASRLVALLGMMEIKGIIKKGTDKKYKVIN